jgi:hypothetical protein
MMHVHKKVQNGEVFKQPRSLFKPTAHHPFIYTNILLKWKFGEHQRGAFSTAKCTDLEEDGAAISHARWKFIWA